MNIQKRYSVLLVVVVLLSALNANVVLHMQSNDYSINNGRLTCCKRTTQTVTAWTYRLSYWGFCTSKNTCGVVKTLLGESSGYLYGVLNAPVQQTTNQEQERSRLQKVARITTKGLFKVTVGVTCFSCWTGKHTASLAKSSFSYLEKAAYRRYATYLDESKQQINVTKADFGIIAQEGNAADTAVAV